MYVHVCKGVHVLCMYVCKYCMFMFAGSPAVTGGLQVVETAPWTRKRTAPVGSHPGLCTGVGSPLPDLYQELWGEEGRHQSIMRQSGTENTDKVT